MDGNIKWLVSAGHEMASELKAECGAVDMRSVAKLISDLATQLEVQLVRANALAEDQQKAIESIKQADAAVKLAHEKFSALAAENAGLKAICDDRRRFIMNGVQVGYIKVPAAETDPDLETIRNCYITTKRPIPAHRCLSWLKCGRKAHKERRSLCCQPNAGCMGGWVYRRHSEERCGHRTNDTDLHRVYG